MEGIERSLSRYIEALGASTNDYLLQHLSELSEEAVKFITWGSVLGSSSVYYSFRGSCPLKPIQVFGLPRRWL